MRGRRIDSGEGAQGEQRTGMLGGQLVVESGKKGELNDRIVVRITTTRQADSSCGPTPLSLTLKLKYSYKTLVMEAAKVRKKPLKFCKRFS